MAETLVGSKTLVDVRDLKMHFPLTQGILFQRVIGYVRAVDGVSFSIERGQTMGLVGESGSGKTTIGRTIVRLYKPTAGQILFGDKDLASMGGEELRLARQRIQMVFQDPFASLNPRYTIGSLIAEPMHIYKVASGTKIRERTAELLSVVGLRPEYIDRYPHEFSGGQRQRIAVMYLGRIVELADRDELYAAPKHPYTKALLSAVPIPDPQIEKRRKRIILSGDLPSPINIPSGCRFHTRCPMAQEICREVEPAYEAKEGREHYAACHFSEKVTPVE